MKSDLIKSALHDTIPVLAGYMVIGMLVVYCLKGISFTTPAGFAPALIATAVVVLSYVWKQNTLLSIISGTVIYMILVQFVF